MMKYPIFLSAMVLATLGVVPGVAANKNSAQVQKTAQTPANNSLTPQEQAFATQLSSLHRQIFTMVFTPSLRQEAMNLMTEGQDDEEEGTAITADMAVEEVIGNHRDMQTSSMPSQQPASSGSQTQQQGQKGSQSTSNNSKKSTYWN